MPGYPRGKRRRGTTCRHARGTPPAALLFSAPGTIGMNSILCSEHDARATDLRRRLDDFYNTTQNYQSFEGPNDKPEFWDPVRREIEAKAAARGRARVLEFGAGYTGFRRYLGELASSVEFDVQDVTPRHVDYLKTQARNVY